MCGWMAWSGEPVLIGEVLSDAGRGLGGASDGGFGMGWYGAGRGPGVYRSTTPASTDHNLRSLAGHLESPLFLAHVRRSNGPAPHPADCQPFAFENWLFVHDGVVRGFAGLRPDLVRAVDPVLREDLAGTSVSEVLFFLALTFGLAEDPLTALERTVGLVEATAHAHGTEPDVQAAIGVTDGSSIWAVRYASTETPRPLFVSESVAAIAALHPERLRLRRLRDDDRLVVSEPWTETPCGWREVEPSGAVVVRPGGELELRPFQPLAASAPASRHR